LWNDDERFVESYLSAFDGYFHTRGVPPVHHARRTILGHSRLAESGRIGSQPEHSEAGSFAPGEYILEVTRFREGRFGWSRLRPGEAPLHPVQNIRARHFALATSTALRLLALSAGTHFSTYRPSSSRAADHDVLSVDVMACSAPHRDCYR
jgi:hypothetical protein